jgi:nucleoside-triphosphatase
MSSHTRCLLLTGVPGVGKTTVIRRVASALSSRRLAGFYTEEIRDGGVRRGFRLRGFDGSEHVIAHVEFSSPQRVGKYGVDVAVLDEVIERVLSPLVEAELVLVDEIGKMECLSRRFVSRMHELLAGEIPLVATVGRKGEGFIAEVKQRSGCPLWEVTQGNREAMPQQVLETLQQWLPGSD